MALLLAAGFGIGGTAEAQDPVRAVVASTGWIGINIQMRESLEPRGGGGASETVSISIATVHEGSPAQEAGLRTGDVIVRINGDPATPQSIERHTRSLEPGDRVRLVVARNGAERSIEVVAAARPARIVATGATLEAMALQVDSVRTVIFRSMEERQSRLQEAAAVQRLQSDSLRAQRQRIVELSIALDTIHRLRISGDSLRVLRGDSILALYFRADSMRWFLPDSLRGFTFRADSIRGWADSIRTFRIRGDSAFVRIWSDSVHGMRFRADSLRIRTPFMTVPRPEGFEIRHVVPYTTFAPHLLGQRAIAGAQMQELSAGLAEFFEVAEGGLLVTEVVEGSPADEAGLRPGDVIVSLDGRPVSTVSEARAALARPEAPRRNEATEMEVVRRGERVRLSLRR